jgi:predicted Zn finger-like uncharacterized protein
VEAQLTQCPQCFTSFKVTPAQMQAAKGMVRCGSCLSVFSANANLIRVKETPPEPAEYQEDLLADQHESAPGYDIRAYNVIAPFQAPEPPSAGYSGRPPPVAYPVAGMAADPAKNHHEVPETADPARRAMQAAAGLPGVNFDYAGPHRHKPVDPPPADETCDADTSPGENENAGAFPFDPLQLDDDPLLTDDISLGDLDLDEDDFAGIDAEDWDEEADDDFNEAADEDDPGEDEDFFEDDDLPDEPEADEEDGHDFDDDDAFGDEDANTAVVFDEDPDEDNPDYFDDAPDDDDQDETPEEDEFAGDDFAADDDFSDEDPDTRPQAQTSSTAGRVNKVALRQYLASIDDEDENHLDALDDETLDALEEEPVTLVHVPGSGRFLRNTLLGLLNLVLVGVLALQYVDQHYLRLAGSARIAPYLPWICRVLDCPPTEAEDIASLYSQEFLIRTHPAAENALELSFIFRNDAERDLPFPGLALSLSDDSNQLLANRLFTPDEYLPAELRQFDTMPGKSSIQVRLDLADPGEAATNYSMAFVPIRQDFR